MLWILIYSYSSGLFLLNHVGVCIPNNIASRPSEDLTLADNHSFKSIVWDLFLPLKQALFFILSCGSFEIVMQFRDINKNFRATERGVRCWALQVGRGFEYFSPRTGAAAQSAWRMSFWHLYIDTWGRWPIWLLAVLLAISAKLYCCEWICWFSPATSVQKRVQD